MQNKPLLSIVTSIYNGGEAIKHFLYSISNQTYENIEVILVDDCSTDEITKSIIADLESGILQFNKKFKLIRNEKNLGLIESFQKGLDNASGEYYAFPESDDYLDLDFYEIMMNEIIAFGQIDVIKGLLLFKYNEERTLVDNEILKNNKNLQLMCVEGDLPLAVRNSNGRIISYLMPDVTYCWFYVFSKQLLKDGVNKPLFKNAILYGFDPSPFSIKYTESRIPLDKASFYYYNAHSNFKEGGGNVRIVDTTQKEHTREINKLECEKNLLQSIFNKYDNVIEILKEYSQC